MQTFGPNVERFFDSTVVETFLVRPKEDWIKLEDRTWVRPVDSNARAAQNVALTATRIPDEWWTPLIEFAGAEKRKGAREGATDRSIVLARTYLEEQAALELEIEFDQLKPLLKSGKIACFMDPAGRLRVSATVIHGLVADRAQLEALLVPEEVSAGDLAEFFNLPLTVIGQRLGMNAKKPSVMVMWPLAQRRLWQPNKAPTLRDFRERLIARREEREADEKRRSERLQRKSEERAEKRRSEREQERLERERLRAQLLAAFPTWRHDRRDEQRLTLHVGPPNSGKTYHAIEALKTAGSGWYLAPLRLLAFEIYDRMNAMGVPCNLLTGEESIQREGALITAATVEMFSPHEKARCVVIDESHMLADAGRGWAWTRALMEATAPDIRVITSPSGRNLIERMAKSADLPFEVVEHQRLTPIAIADRPWTLEMIPSRTILVAFSRRSVLQLKTFLENLKRKVSVVYGNLPPEVRRRQADRFANGETEICIATDAVGMGLNLPADAVCFYEVEKFDGKEHRELNASEVHQIGGRAGRFGLSTAGLIGACDRFSLQVIQNLFNQPLPDLNFARVSPEVEDLALMPGTLSEKYVNWRELNGIPSEWRELLKPADIEERVALAGMLKDQEVERLGLESAVRLVNAPTTESTRLYWRHCADSIIYERPMPIPPNAPERIESGQDLQTTEFAIACADIYLWLSQRPEFEADAADAEAVREERYMWSMNIDEALTKKLDTRARCQSCGKPLPVGHRFAICDRCYHRRRGAY
jgi:ATP-dependent RNA helicase SUPV3L1/SUV3